MNSQIITILTAGIQEYTDLFLMSKTALSRGECAAIAMKTARAFQEILKQSAVIDSVPTQDGQ